MVTDHQTSKNHYKKNIMERLGKVYMEGSFTHQTVRLSLEKMSHNELSALLAMLISISR